MDARLEGPAHPAGPRRRGGPSGKSCGWWPKARQGSPRSSSQGLAVHLLPGLTRGRPQARHRAVLGRARWPCPRSSSGERGSRSRWRLVLRPQDLAPRAGPPSALAGRAALVKANTRWPGARPVFLEEAGGGGVARRQLTLRSQKPRGVLTRTPPRLLGNGQGEGRGGQHARPVSYLTPTWPFAEQGGPPQLPQGPPPGDRGLATHRGLLSRPPQTCPEHPPGIGCCRGDHRPPRLAAPALLPPVLQGEAVGGGMPSPQSCTTAHLEPQK